MLTHVLLAALPVLTQPSESPQAPVPLDLRGALDRARSANPILKAARARVEERKGITTSTRADALPQVALSGDFARSREVSLPAPAASPSNTYTTQVSLSQPLFHWGRFSQATRIAKMGEQEAAHAFTTTELDVLHGAARAYIDVLIAQADLEVIRARRDVAERFLRDIKAKREVQMVTELDRLRAQSEYLAVVPENLQAEARFKRALETLNGQLGLNPRTPLQLGDPGEPIIDSIPAATKRSEIAQHEAQEQMHRMNDRVLQSELLPAFDFNASYGYQTQTTSQLFKEPFETWRVAVSMRFPIFDGLRTSGKRAQNRAQLEQVVQSRIDKERAIDVEGSSAERELQNALAFREAAQAAHQAASEALRNSRESFDQGLITSLDLLQAERTERQQESQRRNAQLGVWTAWFALRRAGGLPPL